MQCMPCPLATNVQVIDVIEQRCQACTEIIDSVIKFSQNNKKLKANMHTIKNVHSYRLLKQKLIHFYSLQWEKTLEKVTSNESSNFVVMAIHRANWQHGRDLPKKKTA